MFGFHVATEKHDKTRCLSYTLTVMSALDIHFIVDFYVTLTCKFTNNLSVRMMLCVRFLPTTTGNRLLEN